MLYRLGRAFEQTVTAVHANYCGERTGAVRAEDEAADGRFSLVRRSELNGLVVRIGASGRPTHMANVRKNSTEMQPAITARLNHHPAAPALWTLARRFES